MADTTMDVQKEAALLLFPLWVRLCCNVAPMASIVVFLAPLPTIQQISQQRSTLNFPLLPYTSMICSCFLWLAYGILKGESKIYVTNFIGLLLGTFYFLKFTQYVGNVVESSISSSLSKPTTTTSTPSSNLPGTLKQHYQGIIFTILGTLTLSIMSPLNVTSMVHSFSGTSSPQLHYIYPVDIIGNIAVIVCIGLFGSPLSTLKLVIASKSATSIPTPFTIATIINCFSWYIVGVYEMKYDYNVIIPNLLGLMFGLVQLYLKVYYDYYSKHGSNGRHLLPTSKK